ncbi:hypothetical protein SIM91_44255 [Rhodococcus opacus]|uniref:hypothetical protein n=1 Tax=Rhodococcus opacus TaxID=37919 RepID=UPI0007CD88FC|nr:hypothetical protein [Rhodococcus opacus]MDX5970156.1 hypothetical protein [Rhodococcus opacus]NKY75174.1 hypothetical protein [Rhodococcus opacus]CAG7633146.1 hypothetical protein E143388_07469 [Rhodococcus opacus]
MSVQREPAIRRPAHPAADLPERPRVVKDPTRSAVDEQPTQLPTESTIRPVADVPVTPVLSPAPEAASPVEKLSEQHNVRLRPSTKARLTRGVDKLRYETGDRSITISSVTDAALIEYLTKNGC